MNTTNITRRDGIENENQEIVWFDVCNDYSLDLALPNTAFGFDVYREKEHTMDTGETVVVLIHKEYNEIHYCKGPRYLNGRYL